MSESSWPTPIWHDAVLAVKCCSNLLAFARQKDAETALAEAGNEGTNMVNWCKLKLKTAWGAAEKAIEEAEAQILLASAEENRRKQKEEQARKHEKVMTQIQNSLTMLKRSHPNFSDKGPFLSRVESFFECVLADQKNSQTEDT